MGSLSAARIWAARSAALSVFCTSAGLGGEVVRLRGNGPASGRKSPGGNESAFLLMEWKIA